jgi:phospholipid/cholesterol/gamma-HCH transport system substrate-binding protein
METRYNYAAVGLFVIAFGLIGTGFSIWLLFGDPTMDYDRYQVDMSESVSGLVADASVTYLGVPVGRVRSIGLHPDDPSRVRLDLQVRRDTPVKTDTTATLRAQGVTGLYYVELQGGTKEAPLLKEASDKEIPLIESVPSMLAQLEFAATDLLGDVTDALDRLTALLSEKNVESISATLDNIEQLSGTIADSRSEIDGAIRDAGRSMADLRRLTGNLAERTDDIDRILTGFSKAADGMAVAGDDLPVVMEDVKAITGDLRETSRELNRLVSSGSSGMEKFSSTTVTDINQLVYEMRDTLDSLKRVSRRLEEQPNSLIFGERPREPGPGEER